MLKVGAIFGTSAESLKASPRSAVRYGISNDFARLVGIHIFQSKTEWRAVILAALNFIYGEFQTHIQ